MAADRIVRFLCSLDSASTSRVLNLRHIARLNAADPEHGQRPLFLSPVINTSFIIKHRLRPDETYMFGHVRSAATKIIVPVDPSDLRAGGRSIFIDQRGFVESLRDAGHYSNENLERDIGVLRLLDAIPSLDPFLLREHLRANNIDVGACYFAISAADQERMHQFVTKEMSGLVKLASGDDDDGSTGRMVSAMLSGQADEKLEPLRMTLGLSAEDFREGAFGWRGLLYYKWAMQDFWPNVMGVLREIKEIIPHGAISDQQRAYLVNAKRQIIEMVRDNNQNISKVLDVYDDSFSELVASNSPTTFRAFLLSASPMFLDLGEKLGAISHIASFWRHRFPNGQPVLIDAEELSIIFLDFTSGFAERVRAQAAPVPQSKFVQV